jgi:DNA repair protein RecO (recombination protein O)
MEWQDEGVILAVHRHGESDAVVSLLTAQHGRWSGWVRGGAGRRARPTLQPGNRVMATWRARLAEQLGHVSAELSVPYASHVLDDAERLAGLGAIVELLQLSLAERDPHPLVYNMLIAYLDVLIEEDTWPAQHVRFELALLADLGFGLDLNRCAVTGQREGLVHVSPRTGRAVSAEGAGEYADRLLPLPPFLIEGGPADREQVLAGFRLTGHFLRRHLFDASERAMPGARERLIDRLARPPQT